MEQLTRIEARLDSLGELSELTGALRSVAAARLREAQAALTGTRDYCAIVDRAIAEISPLAGAGRTERKAPAVLLAIGSEHGFVGGFNRRVVERALGERRPDERLVLVGRRAQIAAAERGIATGDDFPMTSREEGVTPLARRMARRLETAASARLVYAHASGGAGYEIALRQVLPLPKVAEDAAVRAQPPLHHLPPDELLDGLASEYLFAETAHALMESLAAENAARLQTMDAASRNIDKRLETLRRQARAARQEQTTADMLDVVTGAEAVNHG
ncbi:F0F1 ATP synthase subunit gamma [Salipiger mucosus]|uniref:ATP synthase gamma chain n=1 Tax=Salipiger mucosus DSM 16094 TaxID=1123237 RepID=S9QZC6_9RHOB|nr:F0F1 ATP synthase subunit gamma [Salipiger mucosus]EPX84962.1 ATP synthase gamma chain [Salipiger mucosus DSM 16094]